MRIKASQQRHDDGRSACAEWLPNPEAFLRLLANQAPPVLGGWCFIGIISASMSTADGAVLAMGTVLSHNVLRQLDGCFPQLVTPDNLLNTARLSTIPCTLASTLVAAYYHSSRPGGGAGALLIIAFDIVLATVVVPLLGCFYAHSPSPRAALLAIISGAACRLILQFVLPKDGYKIWPFPGPEFYNFGLAVSVDFPQFMDVPAELMWNMTTQPCEQKQYRDYTGMDSVTSFILSTVVYVAVQYYEFKYNRPLFKFAEKLERGLKEGRSIGEDDALSPSLSYEMGMILDTLRSNARQPDSVVDEPELSGSIESGKDGKLNIQEESSPVIVGKMENEIETLDKERTVLQNGGNGSPGRPTSTHSELESAVDEVQPETGFRSQDELEIIFVADNDHSGSTHSS